MKNLNLPLSKEPNPVFTVADLRPGDKLFRSVVGVEFLNHWGNYAGLDWLGRHWVFEHGKGGTCRLSLFDDFAKNYQVRFERILDSDRDLALIRMKELLDSPREYDLLGFNCQHASNYVGTGDAQSGQVALGAAALMVGAILLLNKE
jgi:hypothetical protein